MITTEQIQELRKITTPKELKSIISFAINPHSEKSRAMRNTRPFVELMMKVSDVFKQKEDDMRVKDLGGFDELEDEANQEFYDYEDRAYPNGDSPLSDEHRALFITAWVLGFNTRRTE